MHRARGPDVAPAVNARVRPVLQSQLRIVGLVLVTPLLRRFQRRGREGAGFVLRPVEFQDIVLRVRRRWRRRRAVSLTRPARPRERGPQLGCASTAGSCESAPKGRASVLVFAATDVFRRPVGLSAARAEKQHAAARSGKFATSHEQIENGARTRQSLTPSAFFNPEPRDRSKKQALFERLPSTTRVTTAKQNETEGGVMGRGRLQKRKLYKKTPPEGEFREYIKQKRQAWTSARRASRRSAIVLAAADLDERTGQTAQIPAPVARRGAPWRHRRRAARGSRRRLDSRGHAPPPRAPRTRQRPRRRTTRCIK